VLTELRVLIAVRRLLLVLVSEELERDALLFELGVERRPVGHGAAPGHRRPVPRKRST
jgi:hypothetical protein